MVDKTAKTYLCPYCNKLYNKKWYFKMHLGIHNKSVLKSILYGAITGLIIALVILIFGSQIKYFWDANIMHEEPDFYISVNSVYILNNSDYLYLDNETLINKFIDEQVGVGLIPGYYNGKKPMYFNMLDEEYNLSYCTFWTYNNANRKILAKNLPEDLKELHPEGLNQLFFTTTCDKPDEVVVCNDCLKQYFYGINVGTKEIDFLNLEICYNDNYYIQETEFEKTGNNCFRIKRRNMIDNETFLGSVTIRNIKLPNHYSLWEKGFYSLSGEYKSDSIKHQLSIFDLAQINSGIVPNCEFP